MKLSAFSAISAAALLVVGCVDHSHDVAVYRKLLDGHSPATQPVYDAAKPLTLVEALRIANADNESIAARGEDYIQALAQKMRDTGTFLPKISLSPGLNYSGSDHSNVPQSSGLPASAGMSVSLADLTNVKSDQFTIEQREQLLLNEREAILLQVAQTYYDVLRYEQQSNVLENSVKLKTEKVRDQEARLKLESARPLDVAQTQADLAATRVSLTQARTNAINARSILARLMAVTKIDGPLSDAFVPPEEIGPDWAWHQRAEQQRQDLIASQKSTEAARANVEAAIQQYFPSVSINFNYYLASDPGNGHSWTGGISANVPIFSALAIEADIRRAWSAYRQAGLSQSQTQRIVRDDINQSYQNLASSRQKIIDLKIQVEAAQRAFDLSERANALGSDTNLNRLVQQDNLLTAQLNLLSEEYNAKAYYLALLRACGELGRLLN